MTKKVFMVKAIRYVKDAFINDGDGVMDFVGTVERLKPDCFVVNDNKAFCQAHPEAISLKIRRK